MPFDPSSILHTLSPVLVGLLLFIGLAFGTALGVPAFPLYLIAGGVWGAAALPFIAVALLIHLSLVYFISHTFLQRFLHRLINRFLPASRQTRLSLLGPRQLTVLVRVIPGLPLFVQSYFLAFCGVPFGVCLVWSLAIQLPFAYAMSTAGKAALSGQWWMFSVAVIAFILLGVLLRLLYKRFSPPASS
jgi:uncharacterized membrane protein YdjX (TVP38/TMEM64 family)